MYSRTLYFRTHATHSVYSTNQSLILMLSVCLTGSQRTICLWFQGELPVDRSIFNPLMYKTLLALWDLLLDTCRNITNIITKFGKDT